MANNISGRQIILDTASTTPIITWNLKVSDAFWANAASGATLSFTDLGGRTFNYVQTTQADYPFDIGKLGWLSGLVLTNISSGILYLIIDK